MNDPRRHAIEALLLISVTILLLWPTIVHGDSPSTTALNTFETLRNAEASGANIASLVSQYNSLLQQSAPNSSFISLQNQATAAQKAATAAAALSSTMIIVLVPIIPFFLALLAVGITRLSARLAKERKLDMEVGRA
jgi:methionyl-tRNA synthetase